MSEFYKCEHGQAVCGFCLKMLERQYKDVESERDRLRAQNEELVKAINEAISKVDDAPFEWIRLNQDYLKPIVRPLKQALKSAEAK